MAAIGVYNYEITILTPKLFNSLARNLYRINLRVAAK